MPPLAASAAAAAAAVSALACLHALMVTQLKIDAQPATSASEAAFSLSLSLSLSSAPLAVADRVVRTLLELHAVAITLAQAASTYYPYP